MVVWIMIAIWVCLIVVFNIIGSVKKKKLARLAKQGTFGAQALVDVPEKTSKMIQWISIVIYGGFMTVFAGLGQTPPWWAVGLGLFEIIFMFILGKPFQKPVGPNGLNTEVQ